MTTRVITLTLGLLMLSACAVHETQVQAPLTPHSVQQAKVREKSGQVHTVLMTLTGNEIPAVRDVSSAPPLDEPGDGDSIAMGSEF